MKKKNKYPNKNGKQNMKENNRIWDLISAYSDDELNSEDKYFVMKKIKEDDKYRNTLKDINNIKNAIHSIEKKKTSNTFNEALFEKIKNDENLPKLHDNIISFKSISTKIISGVAAAAIFAITLVFVIRFVNLEFDNPNTSEIVSDFVEAEKTHIEYDTLDGNGTVAASREVIILGPDEAAADLKEESETIVNKEKSNEEDSLYMASAEGSLTMDEELPITNELMANADDDMIGYVPITECKDEGAISTSNKTGSNDKFQEKQITYLLFNRVIKKLKSFINDIDEDILNEDYIKLSGKSEEDIDNLLDIETVNMMNTIELMATNYANELLNLKDE